MEETSLVSSIRILESNYTDAVHDRGELDERMFVNDEDSLFGSVRASVDSTNILGTKVCFIAAKFSMFCLMSKHALEKV